MKINNLSNLHFRSVIPIATPKGELPKIKKELEEQTENKNYALRDYTSLYEQGCVVNGYYYQALAEKFDIGVLVTGQEYYNWIEGQNEWCAYNAPLFHVNSKVPIIVYPDRSNFAELINAVEEKGEPSGVKLDKNYLNYILEKTPEELESEFEIDDED